MGIETAVVAQSMQVYQDRTVGFLSRGPRLIVEWHSAMTGEPPVLVGGLLEGRVGHCRTVTIESLLDKGGLAFRT